MLPINQVVPVPLVIFLFLFICLFWNYSDPKKNYTYFAVCYQRSKSVFKMAGGWFWICFNFIVAVGLLPTVYSYCFTTYKQRTDNTYRCRNRVNDDRGSFEHCCSLKGSIGYSTNLKGWNCQICPSALSEEASPVWSEWGEWSVCSRTCDWGLRSRTRNCVQGLCDGASIDQQYCIEVQNCPVDGNWGSWGVWTSCSKTCSVGIRSRSRECNSPPPFHNGRTCLAIGGDSVEKENCIEVENCPINGNWGNWQSYSPCSATCGGDATRTRERACDNPPAQYGGLQCEGVNKETINCGLGPCPISDEEVTESRDVPQSPAAEITSLSSDYEVYLSESSITNNNEPPAPLPTKCRPVVKKIAGPAVGKEKEDEDYASDSISISSGSQNQNINNDEEEKDSSDSVSISEGSNNSGGNNNEAGFIWIDCPEVTVTPTPKDDCEDSSWCGEDYYDSLEEDPAPQPAAESTSLSDYEADLSESSTINHNEQPALLPTKCRSLVKKVTGSLAGKEKKDEDYASDSISISAGSQNQHINNGEEGTDSSNSLSISEASIEDSKNEASFVWIDCPEITVTPTPKDDCGDSSWCGEDYYDGSLEEDPEPQPAAESTSLSDYETDLSESSTIEPPALLPTRCRPVVKAVTGPAVGKEKEDQDYASNSISISAGSQNQHINNGEDEKDSSNSLSISEASIEGSKNEAGFVWIDCPEITVTPTPKDDCGDSSWCGGDYYDDSLEEPAPQPAAESTSLSDYEADLSESSTINQNDGSLGSSSNQSPEIDDSISDNYYESSLKINNGGGAGGGGGAGASVGASSW